MNGDGKRQQDQIYEFTCGMWGDAVLLESNKDNIKVSELIIRTFGKYQTFKLQKCVLVVTDIPPLRNFRV